MGPEFKIRDLGGLGRGLGSKEFGLAALAVWLGPWGGLCKKVWARTEFINSVSGGLGRRIAPKEFGLAALAVWLGPWAGLCKNVWAQGRIPKIGIGRPWAENRFCGFISSVPQTFRPISRPICDRFLGPKAEFLKSVSGGLGRRIAPKEFGLAALAVWLGPWAGLCKTGRAQSRIPKAGVGRLWAEIRSQGIRLGGYSFWLGPWAGLCKTGWAQSRISKVGVGRPWAEIRSQRIRLGGYSFWLGPWAGLRG